MDGTPGGPPGGRSRSTPAEPSPEVPETEPGESRPAPAGPQARLRPARLTDLDAIADLERSCFGGEAWSRESVRSELDAPPGARQVLVAEQAGEVVGYAILWITGPSADLPRIGVRPRARRRGLARRLLEGVLDGARRRGCEEVLLEVRADNQAALALYRAYGFDVIATRRGYYDAGRGDALVLRAGLRRS